MRRNLPAFLLVVVASTSAFAEITFDPPAPTNQSFVTLRIREPWGSVCTPRDPVVARHGATIDIHWTIGDCVGLPFPSPWWEDVAIGVLAAGAYTVQFSVDDDDAIIQPRTLVVTDADATLGVSPPYASTRGDTEIVVFEPEECFTFPLIGAMILIDGVEVPSSTQGCIVTARAPAHAVGAVTVALRTTDGLLTAPFALTYLDPAAPADPSVFERVLLPIVYNGPGAFGSQWVTETNLESRSLTFDWFHDFERAACKDGGCSTPPQLSDFRDHPAGLMVTVPRRQSQYVTFSMRVRDTSRSDRSWGAEVPIVREADLRQELVFNHVPFDPRYRLALRLYSMRGDPRVWVVRSGEERKTLQLNGPCAVAPCASEQPSFVTFELNQLFPNLAGTGARQVRIEESMDLKWGFITVTNNETQEVTVISPMR